MTNVETSHPSVTAAAAIDLPDVHVDVDQLDRAAATLAGVIADWRGR